ncbi:MAG: GDSL-type esterase/lipase family protein [Pseudomonadota bacterium]|nr:GDSL-type esterase/lipase family protein [Pseudomonadota bacterium]
MRRYVARIGALICALGLAGAVSAEPAAGPTPYPSPTAKQDWPGEGVIRVFGWMKQNRDGFWRQREKKQGAWVLAGDSLFGNWKTSERDLGPITVANRAIGGDVSRGLLFRFQEDVLDLKPSGIAILIGGNDLSAHQKTEQTARNIERMLQAVRAQNPSTPVVLCTLPPRDSVKAPIKQSELTNLNASIEALAAAWDNVELLDLNPLFATADGQPQLALFSQDRLHIGPAGYEVLARALKAKIESMRGKGP